LAEISQNQTKEANHAADQSTQQEGV
jgi:hypothetical protein